MDDEPARGPRTPGTLAALLGVALLMIAGLIALGVWQVQRLAWKQELIARIDRQVHAVPAAPPAIATWATLTRDTVEYRRVALRGRYLPAADVLVNATTALGAGHWVMTPLRDDQGITVLVNRGFVPLDLPRDQARAPDGEQRVVGLLRLSEPGGSLLQRNDAAQGRWYSRDVAAIAASQQLTGPVAPYFVDTVAEPGAAPAWPRPGLTVLSFSNNHLVYAATWFALAAMVAGAAGYLVM
ncbi:MAG: SURF1 family protein, partial [Rhizobacter sp.]